MNYQYNSGLSFTYKWWSVEIEEYVLGTMKITFKIDSMSIYFAILSALKEKKLDKDPKLKSILDDAANKSLEISLDVVDSFKTFHTFNCFDKCKNDAISHIDNNLGDALTYAKNNNKLSYLKHFT